MAPGRRGEDPARDQSQTLEDGLRVGGSQAGRRVPTMSARFPASSVSKITSKEQFLLSTVSPFFMIWREIHKVI